MSETTVQLKARTMRFALAACALIKQLPREEPGQAVKRQLAKPRPELPSTTVAPAVPAHTLNSRPASEWVAEEADEAQGWLEFIVESGLITSSEAKRLFREATELSAIFLASYGTARERERGKRDERRRKQKSRT